MLEQILNFFYNAIQYIINIYIFDGIYLLISIIIAVVFTVYIDPLKIRKFFLNHSGFSVFGSVGLGAFTPLCACGTMAVIMSIVSTSLPWGPIMAFLVSSPLMSPDVFILLAGFINLSFAIALTIASIILGLGAGYITHLIEKNTGFLNNQLRLNPKVISLDKESYNNCCGLQAGICLSDGCDKDDLNVKPKAESFFEKIKPRQFLTAFYNIGFKMVLPLFTLFVFLAYIVKTYVPANWIMALFSGKHFYSIPLAAIIGIPLYVSDAAIIPLLQVLKDAGASYGTILAFMVTGPGTSLGVLAGLTMIMKKRSILLYFTFILGGAILLGYLFDFVIFYFKIL